VTLLYAFGSVFTIKAYFQEQVLLEIYSFDLYNIVVAVVINTQQDIHFEKIKLQYSTVMYK